MRTVLLILSLLWIVPLLGLTMAALAAGVSRRARSFLHRTLVTG
ncbi:hypothetical protein [Sphingomonas prati]|uniref:Uncharacterized protein n=1 Tax=Sphingomonas prati TaxID=1843237 RepID=A0A7W9F2M7_9SPHN|nr:hypothetical protein [Sphingomonas prati]MBB5728944.1 hypothetical protein [Sphingomonas prati]